MENDEPNVTAETGLTIWRRSYYRLRALERQLVDASRGAEEPGQIEALYREIEALRLATSELFTAAQVESVSHHVKLFRAGSAAAYPAADLPPMPPQPVQQVPESTRTAAQPRRRSAPAAGSRPLAIATHTLRPPP